MTDLRVLEVDYSTLPTNGQVPVYDATTTTWIPGINGVTSVSASDTTLTISPTTSAVLAAVNQAADFNWTGVHNFGPNPMQCVGLSSNVGVGALDLTANSRLADDNGVTLEGGPVRLRSYDYGNGYGIATDGSDLHLRDDLNLADTDFDVLRFGTDPWFYASGNPLRFTWSNFDTGDGWLEFTDGGGSLQTFRSNISAESVYADSLVYAPNVYVTSLATGRIPFSNSGNLSSSANLFWDIANNRLGLLTATPTYTLSLGQGADRTIKVEENASTTGNNLIVAAGNSKTGVNDRWGGALRLYGGDVTGNGQSTIEFYTAFGTFAGGTSTRYAATKKCSINGIGGLLFGSGAGSGFVNSGIMAGIDISYGGSPAGLAVGAENNLTTRTNSTAKVFRMGLAPYNTAHQLGAILVANATSTANVVTFGGGTSVFNGATQIEFATQTAVGIASSNVRFLVNASGQVVFSDGVNLVFNTTTGTKFGTATSQKIGFWNAPPIVQPTTAIAVATFVANTSGIVDNSATFDGYTIGQVVKALRNVGILA